MADKATVLKATQKFLAKGQIDKAIQLWENFVSANPDGNTFNTIGDLYVKNNNKKNAVIWFHKAAKYLRDEGFSPKAIAIYKKVLNLDSSDPTALQSLGELNEEKGLVPDAIKFYLATIDALHKKKQTSLVIEIYNKILNIAPSNIPLRKKIAENLIKEGFKEDASKEFAYLARLSEEKGDSTAANDHFEKALQLNPKNKNAYLSMCKLYETVGKSKEAHAVLDKALKVFPNDSDIRLQLSDLLISGQDFDKAKDLLREIGEKEPDNIKVREKIANIYLKKGQKDKAWKAYSTIIDDMLLSSSPEQLIKILTEFKGTDPVEVGKRLASVYKQAGNNDGAFQELLSVGTFLKNSGLSEEALDVLNEARQINPDNEEVTSLIASLNEGPSSAQEPSAPPSGGVDIAGEESFIERTAHETEEEPVIKSTTFESTSFEAPAEEESFVESTSHEEIELPVMEEPPAPAPVEEKEKSVEESLTEVEVLLRYGQSDPALDILESLKSSHPSNIEVHKKLKLLYSDKGEKELAITECLVLANLYDKAGEKEKKDLVLQDAFDIDPNDPRLADRLTAVPSEGPAQKGKAAVSESDYSEEMSEADFYLRQGLVDEALKIYNKYAELMPDNTDLQEKIRQAHVELESAEAPAPETEMEEVLASAPREESTPEVSLDDFSMEFSTGEEEEAVEELSTGEFDSGIQLDDYAVDSAGEELSLEEDTLPDIEEGLTEGDLTAEIPAEFTSYELPSAEPAEEEVSSLDEEEEIAEAVLDEGFEALSIEDMETPTAEELPEPTLENDVLEIFEEFKKGIETELEEEDSDTHYNLGIAYKEMGLVDDAIKEFQTANKDPRKTVQASSMLGVCYKEKGLYSLAIDALKMALAAISDQDDAYWGTKYDLAEAYQQNGNIKEALEHYTEIYAHDSKFRNVHEKMNSLKGVKVKEAAPDESAAAPEPKKKKKDRISYI